MLDKLGILLLIILIGLAILGGLALFIIDIGKEDVNLKRCFKCGNRRLRKLKKDDKQFSTSKWKCTSCGNNEDEFGNKL